MIQTIVLVYLLLNVTLRNLTPLSSIISHFQIMLFSNFLWFLSIFLSTFFSHRLLQVH